MKNAVIGFFMVIVLIFAGISIQTAENRTSRKNELDNSLGTAMEQSMKILTINPIYHVEKEKGTDEFVSDFIQGFLMKTSGNGEFTVNVLKVNVEKGILDVSVVEKYKQIIGYGEITSRKTVILEDLEKKENVFRKVTFLISSKESTEQKIAEGVNTQDPGSYILKQVNIHNGDTLTAAVLPKSGLEKEGYRFCGWRMAKPENGVGILYGEGNIESIFVTEDIEFQAVYEEVKR